MQYPHLRFWIVSETGNETICLGILQGCQIILGSGENGWHY